MKGPFSRVVNLVILKCIIITVNFCLLFTFLCWFCAQVDLDQAKELNASVLLKSSVIPICRLEIYSEKRSNLTHQEVRSWYKSCRKENWFLRLVMAIFDSSCRWLVCIMANNMNITRCRKMRTTIRIIRIRGIFRSSPGKVVGLEVFEGK